MAIPSPQGLRNSQRSQILVGLAALAALALAGIAAFTLAGSNGADTTNLETFSQSLTDAVPATASTSSPDPSTAEVAPAGPSTALSTTRPTITAPTSVVAQTAAPAAALPAPSPTTAAPSTAAPTTAAPTTAAPTTAAPTTAAPTTAAPTTAAPSTAAPTTAAPSIAAPTTAAPTTAAPGGGVASQIVNLVNVERAKAGCGALSLNGQLNNAAFAHSEDMYLNDYFDHTGLDGSKPWDRAARAGYGGSTIGENIAAGYGSAEAVMNGWMNSAGHRANILNCSFKHLGVGLSSGGNYWTQLFGG